MTTRMALLAAVAGGLLVLPAGFARQDQPPAEKAGKLQAVKADAADIVRTLQTQRVSFPGNLNDTPLFELIQNLAKQFDVNFVFREELFKERGEANFIERKPVLFSTRLEGLTLHRFLDMVLTSMQAAYLVRDGYIEIVPREFAVKEVGFEEAIQEAGVGDDAVAAVKANARVGLPIVCVVAENKALQTVLTDLARVYDLNVVIESGVRDIVKNKVVTERLLNVPADTALELLAGQADLNVIRKGNTFRVTTGGGAQ